MRTGPRGPLPSGMAVPTRRDNVHSRVRRYAYRLGLLSAYHNTRNRHSLTVVMFHRVLGTDDPRWAGADPEWTLSTEVFGECLRFFARHYRVVGLDRLQAHCERGTPLPRRSLLITFDDGWADNAEYAAPLLARFGLPATVFVVADAVGRREPFWQERIYDAWARGNLESGTLDRLLAAAGTEAPRERVSGDRAVRGLIDALAKMPDAERSALIGRHLVPEADAGPPAMLSLTQLRSLCEQGFAIGSHGLTHVPLTRSPDPARELRESRARLQEALGGDKPAVTSLSFPHGAHDEQVVRQATEAGYRLLFTSVPVLNRMEARPPERTVFGRIHIPAREICDQAGGFLPERLAAWLFLRPCEA